MILQFTLSMPNIGSWNGKWSGESNLYAMVKNFGKGKAMVKHAESILKLGYCHYNFGDGWAAGVTITKIDSKTARKVRKASKGFCRYDWMVYSIMRHGEILNTNQRKELESA